MNRKSAKLMSLMLSAMMMIAAIPMGVMAEFGGASEEESSNLNAGKRALVSEPESISGNEDLSESESTTGVEIESTTKGESESESNGEIESTTKNESESTTKGEYEGTTSDNGGTTKADEKTTKIDRKNT